MTAELATFVASQLGGDRVHAVFGGWAIYRDGEMVAILYEGRTYLTATTEAAQARFIAAGMGPFRPGPSKPSSRSGRSRPRSFTTPTT